jgi:hypothetical protein
MLFGLLRRVFGLACLLLVAWAAVTVPIGRRTAWGHLTAIFTTEPAREAAEDLQGIAIETLRGVDRNKSITEPSQGPAPRGKTPAPGSPHVRSAQQGVPAGS